MEGGDGAMSERREAANRAAFARAEERWLEPPNPPDQPECPECGAGMEEDRVERSVQCGECGFADSFDWDSLAEARISILEFER